jgi:hypothetical protein
MSIFHHHAMATGASCLASACSSAGTLISNPFFYESGRGAPVYGLAEAVGVAATPVAEDEEVLVLVETGGSDHDGGRAGDGENGGVAHID